jgi:hypothetical protein
VQSGDVLGLSSVLVPFAIKKHYFIKQSEFHINRMKPILHNNLSSFLTRADQEACIMELLDESTGELYTFDWCKAEMHEPAPADAGTVPSRQPSLEVFQNVASSLWKAPLGALSVLGRMCSALVRGRRV